MRALDGDRKPFDEIPRHVVVPRSGRGCGGAPPLREPEEGGQDLVFRDEADPPLDLDRLPERIETKDLDRSLLLVEHPHGDVEEGGLAGAVATEQADHLSVVNCEIDAVEYGNAGFERSVNIVQSEGRSSLLLVGFRGARGRP